MIGGEDMYQAVCRMCYMRFAAEISKDNETPADVQDEADPPQQQHIGLKRMASIENIGFDETTSKKRQFA